MENNTLNAASNAALANSLISKALEDTAPPVEPAKITAPSETLVNLPGGYLLPTGEVITTAEVRELTGRDEEALSKISNAGRVLAEVLSRAVVKIGDKPANEAMLDGLLTGDRDSLLLGVYRATFGNPSSLGAWCGGCEDYKEVEINLDEEVTVKALVDPINDRVFKVQGKKNSYVVTLPTGTTAKQLAADENRTLPELTTILLKETVLEINDSPVVSPLQVQNLGLADRREIGKEIASRSPGPQFKDISVSCPDCGGEVVVPLNIGALFRF
jgi:hypothetical protein